MSPCKEKIDFRMVKGQTELVIRPAHELSVCSSP